MKTWIKKDDWDFLTTGAWVKVKNGYVWMTPFEIDQPQKKFNKISKNNK